MTGIDLNRLENVCLLEKHINTSVGNKSLKGKLLVKKDDQYYYQWVPGTKRHTYAESKFIMPKKFYSYDSTCGSINGINSKYYEVKGKGECIYTKDCAKIRVNDLKIMISKQKRYKEDLNGVFG